MMHGGNTPKIIRKQFCSAIKSILKGEADAHPCELASEDMNYRPGYIRCVRDATIEERNSAVAWNGN